MIEQKAFEFRTRGRGTTGISADIQRVVVMVVGKTAWPQIV